MDHFARAARSATQPVLGPHLASDRWVWRSAALGASVLFVGRGASQPLDARGAAGERASAMALAGAEVTATSWLDQVHSADVVEARPGCCGPGDALLTARGGLALSVVTADCVPVLLATGRRVSAVHAGWRGVAAGIVGAAVERLAVEERSAGDPAPPAGWCAWVGPSIGACCYEVGPDVAERVIAASSPAVAHEGPAGRPHVDLPRAVLHQLAAAGVGTVRPILWCTRCEDRYLHSYRREGPGAGRNRALIWRVSG